LTEQQCEYLFIYRHIRKFGKGNVTEKDIRKLAEKLGRKTKDKMLTEAQYATSWVYEYIKRICAEDTK